MKIIVDSACDLNLEDYKNKNIEFVPLKVIFGEESYLDIKEISSSDFFDKLINSGAYPKTSQPSPQDFLQLFTSIKENNEEVICILLSSALSGTYQSASIAKEMIEYDNIHLVDTMTASFGIRNLIEVAVKMRDENKSILEIVDTLNTIKTKLKTMGIVDTLEYLSKGGRLPKSVAKIGEMANLKPIVEVNNEGKIVLFDKAIGKARANAKLLNVIANDDIDFDLPFVFAYSYDSSNVINLIDKASTKNEVFKDSEPVSIGAVIGAHLGPNASGVSYFIK